MVRCAGKGTVYEGGIKVCTCVRWPGRIAGGSQSTQRALSMDSFPTLCEAAEVDIPHEIDGRSFLPTLFGKEQAPLRKYWFWRRREGGQQFGGKTIEAVRRDDWKLLQNSPFAPQELYDLSNDPLEKRDLSRLNREEFNELSAVLRREIQRYGSVPWQRAASHAEPIP